MTGTRALATSGAKAEREDDEMVCEVIEISRTHFQAPIERLIFVSIDGMVHKLGRTMYALQDACSSVAKKLGCKLGTCTHCVLTRGNLVTRRCGDDHPALGMMRTSRSTSCWCRATSLGRGRPPHWGDQLLGTWCSLHGQEAVSKRWWRRAHRNRG